MFGQGIVVFLGLQGGLVRGIPVSHGALLRLVKAQREGDGAAAEDDLLLASRRLLRLCLRLRGRGWLWLRLLRVARAQGQRLRRLLPLRLLLREGVLAVALAADGGGGGGSRGAPQAAGPLAGDVATAQRGSGGHLEGVCRGAAAHLLDGVSGRLEEDDVDLVEEDAGQQAEAGRQDGDHLHRRDELAVSAGVGGDEGDPDDEEDEHAEGDELGFVEVLRQLAGLEGEEETDGGQQAGVADQEAQRHERALVAGDEDDLVLQLVVAIARGGRRIEPNGTDDNLHEGAEEDQQELQVEPPPLAVEAGGNLGLKHQEDPIGFHQDARDAEHEADAKGWLAQATGPVLGLSNEEQGAGEAAEQGEEEEVGEFPVCGLDDGCVAELDEDTQHKGCEENAQHSKQHECNPKGLSPGQKLDLLGDAGGVVLIGPEVIRALITGTCICKMSQ